jgi:hypothetical protein
VKRAFGSDIVRRWVSQVWVAKARYNLSVEFPIQREEQGKNGKGRIAWAEIDNQRRDDLFQELLRYFANTFSDYPSDLST